MGRTQPHIQIQMLVECCDVQATNPTAQQVVRPQGPQQAETDRELFAGPSLTRLDSDSPPSPADCHCPAADRGCPWRGHAPRPTRSIDVFGLRLEQAITGPLLEAVRSRSVM